MLASHTVACIPSAVDLVVADGLVSVGFLNGFLAVAFVPAKAGVLLLATSLIGVPALDGFIAFAGSLFASSLAVDGFSTVSLQLMAIYCGRIPCRFWLLAAASVPIVFGVHDVANVSAIADIYSMVLMWSLLPPYVLTLLAYLPSLASLLLVLVASLLLPVFLLLLSLLLLLLFLPLLEDLLNLSFLLKLLALRILNRSYRTTAIELIILLLSDFQNIDCRTGNYGIKISFYRTIGFLTHKNHLFILI